MHQQRTLTVFTLLMINIAAICNVKNFPLISIYGFSAIAFLALAALIYFIPVSLVSAELATGWPKRGIYVWVREALGGGLGFLAIWLQWMENVIWYPTILSFIAATFAYLFDPALANNKIYILSIVLSTFWIFTFLNLLGMRIAAWISSISALFGTILPGAFIILLGIIWYAQGNPLQVPITKDTIFPSLSSINQLVVFAGILLSLAGMEMSSVHALEVKHPGKDYPKSIFLSAILILILYSLGSLAVAIVVPKEQLNLASGAMEAFTFFLTRYHLEWMIPVIALVMTIGGLGMMSTWILGPTKGVLAAALDGDLPPFFQKINRRNMPTNLLLAQAGLVSLLSLVFLLMPTVTSSYWILINLTVQLYLLMYILMFLSAIVLRYKFPHTPRPYKIPGGKVGIWIVGGVGLLSSLLVFFLGFVPPDQIDVGKTLPYESFLIGGLLIFCLIPYVIYITRKKGWKKAAEEI